MHAHALRRKIPLKESCLKINNQSYEKNNSKTNLDHD